MGRWPEGPFVEFQEIMSYRKSKFAILKFGFSKFVILKFGFSKIGNFDFQKLNFSDAFVTAKNSKTG